MNERLKLAIEKNLNNLVDRIPLLIEGVLVLVITWLVARWFWSFSQRAVARLSHDRSVQLIVARLGSILIWILGVMVAISIALPEFRITTMVTTLGIGSIAVGFAFKEVFENFISGLYLLLTRPFSVGDTIEAEGHRGVVEEIGIRATRLRLANHEVILIPSAKLFRDSVRVISNGGSLRFQLRIGLEMSHATPRHWEEILAQMNGIEGVNKERAATWTSIQAEGGAERRTLSWWGSPGLLDRTVVEDTFIHRLMEVARDSGWSSSEKFFVGVV